MEAIVAVYSDWGIGSGGTQPVVLKADRAHFKELTDGAAVIVGRKTLGDFPGGRPLKGRHNIVVTRQDIEVAGAQVAHSTGEALALAAEYERCLVIGGASVYKALLDKYSLKAEECVFIDDRLENVQAAFALGFAGIQMKDSVGTLVRSLATCNVTLR